MIRQTNVMNKDAVILAARGPSIENVFFTKEREASKIV